MINTREAWFIYVLVGLVAAVVSLKVLVVLPFWGFYYSKFIVTVGVR